MFRIGRSLLGEIGVSPDGEDLLAFDDLADDSGEQPLDPFRRVPADHGSGVR